MRRLLIFFKRKIYFLIHYSIQVNISHEKYSHKNRNIITLGDITFDNYF